MYLICFVTARPSFSRVKSVLEHLKSYPQVKLKIVTIASANVERYGNVEAEIKKAGFEVLRSFSTQLENTDPVSSVTVTGLGTIFTAQLLADEKPDAVITIADRYETIATAIAASYLNIPVIHLQGGEVTGNIDERVRHAITKLSDYHFVSNESARSRVLKMGEHPDRVFNLGCPSLDICIEAEDLAIETVENVVNNVGIGDDWLPDKPYLVMLLHPETENAIQSTEQIRKVLIALETSDLQKIIFWPNVDIGSNEISKEIRIWREKHIRNFGVRLIKNLPGKIFLRLLSSASFLIGNSSVGIRECSFLGRPVINIGERQKGRDRAKNVIDVGWSVSEIINAIEYQKLNTYLHRSSLYGDGTSGKKIAKYVTRLKLSQKGVYFDG